LNRLGRGWKDFDFYILITTLVLMGFSAVTIYSADGGGPLTPSNLGVRQALYGSLGLVLMLIVASIDYRILGSLAWAIYGAAMIALTCPDDRHTGPLRPRASHRPRPALAHEGHDPANCPRSL